MSSAITGAAIGFLVWNALALARVINGVWLPVRVPEWPMVVFPVCGAAIGWLIGGGA